MSQKTKCLRLRGMKVHVHYQNIRYRASNRSTLWPAGHPYVEPRLCIFHVSYVGYHYSCVLTHRLCVCPSDVFEELSVTVQEKDSLSSELHVRHIAIEQLFKNCTKLPWLQIGRAGVKAGNNPVEWVLFGDSRVPQRPKRKRSLKQTLMEAQTDRKRTKLC